MPVLSVMTSLAVPQPTPKASICPFVKKLEVTCRSPQWSPVKKNIPAVAAAPVLRQNSVRREVVDLPALIRRRSWFDDHPPAPPAPTPPVPVRRPPPARPGETRLAAATGRLQADGEPAEASTDRSCVSPKL